MANLAPEQVALLPTPEEIEQYRQKGWYVTKPIFSEYEIEQALLDIKRYYRGERDADLPEKVKPHLLDWKKDSLRVDTYITHYNHQVRQLMKNPLVGACAALLIGSDEIRLFNSVLIYKSSKGRACQDNTSIGWHADTAYFKTCTSEKMLTVWIPLQDSDETMGTPSFLEGSHLSQDDTHLNALRQEKNFISDNFTVFEKQLLADNQLKIVHTRLQRCQCCFFDSKVFHYTGQNVSERPRLAVTLFLQDKANRYRKVYDEQNNLIYHTNDILCRRLSDGNPDYTDPTFCPILWPI
ncbi:phytanoyl-CoA dioxygenase family protein [uncultured Nostoc sp.]|uniref:phytanoyl-CoA dioxygenase family protein n=1 Tax=uncultured Nostoc sp. TaxID=340711 RepID=UPI0035C996D9